MREEIPDETIQLVDGVKYMPVDLFRDLGYLQEVNRQFFHPLGFALEVKVDRMGNMTLGGIWDCRDDPEGMVFEPGLINTDVARIKKNYVAIEMTKRAHARVSKLGYAIQPINVPGSIVEDAIKENLKDAHWDTGTNPFEDSPAGAAKRKAMLNTAKEVMGNKPEQEEKCMQPFRGDRGEILGRMNPLTEEVTKVETLEEYENKENYIVGETYGIEVGDKVQLKSGGPDMEVLSIKEKEDQALCEWPGDDGVLQAYFFLETIKKV